MQHVGGLYQVLTFLHKYHSDEKAVLFTESINKSNHIFQGLKDAGFFSDIIFFEKQYKEEHLVSDNWENQVIKYYSDLFSENHLNLDDFLEIYCSFDTFNDILVYFVHHERKVKFIELAAGELARDKYSIETILLGGDIRHEELIRRYDVLNGKDNENVTLRYVFKKQLEKDVEFDFINEFYDLDKEYAQKIKKAMGIDEIRLTPNASLYFLNSTGYTVPKAREYVYIVHGLICDICLGDSENIWIKDHPANLFLEGVRRNFNIFTERSLGGEIPIEFFFLGGENRVNRVVSCASSSNEKIKKFVEEELYLGDETIVNFRLLFKIAISFSLFDGLTEQYRSHYMGVNKSVLVNYRKGHHKTLPDNEPMGIFPSIIKGKVFVFIDKINKNQENQIHFALKEAGEESVVVFFNSDESFNFIPSDDKLWDCFTTIKITKKSDIPGDYEYLKDEYLYVFCKNKALRKQFAEFKFEHYLPHVKCEVDAEKTENTLLYRQYARMVRNAYEARVKELNYEMSHTYRTIIWHSGRLLDNFINSIKLYENRGKIKILGIAHMFTAFENCYGYPSLQVSDFSDLKPEVIIVMEEGKAYKQAVDAINQLYPGNSWMILPYKAFSLQNLNITKYNNLLTNPVTILANNCWGGITYNRLGLEFHSPLINMFLKDEDYLKFLQRPWYYTGKELEFDHEELNNDTKKNFPVMRVDDVLFYCNHYENAEEAKTAWENRRKKINWNNVFVMMFTKDKAVAEKFTKLPYDKKVCFVPFEMEGDGICYLDYSDTEAFRDKALFWMVNEHAFGGLPYYDTIELLLTGNVVKNSKRYEGRHSDGRDGEA